MHCVIRPNPLGGPACTATAAHKWGSAHKAQLHSCCVYALPSAACRMPSGLSRAHQQQGKPTIAAAQPPAPRTPASCSWCVPCSQKAHHSCWLMQASVHAGHVGSPCSKVWLVGGRSTVTLELQHARSRLRGAGFCCAACAVPGITAAEAYRSQLYPSVQTPWQTVLLHAFWSVFRDQKCLQWGLPRDPFQLHATAKGKLSCAHTFISSGCCFSRHERIAGGPRYLQVVVGTLANGLWFQGVVPAAMDAGVTLRAQAISSEACLLRDVRLTRATAATAAIAPAAAGPCPDL
jgi:hypothetical protein